MLDARIQLITTVIGGPGSAGPAYVANLLPSDVRAHADPIVPVLERLDPLLLEPVALSDDDLDALVDFVGNGLLDPDARAHRLRRFMPEKNPSGREMLTCQF